MVADVRSVALLREKGAKINSQMVMFQPAIRRVLYLGEFLGCDDGSNCKLRANTNLNRSPIVTDMRNAPVIEAEGSKNQITGNRLFKRISVSLLLPGHRE